VSATPATITAEEAPENATSQRPATRSGWPKAAGPWEPVLCVYCRRELHAAPNGAKAKGGGYTCWDAPGWTKHVAERPFPEDLDASAPVQLNLVLEPGRRELQLSGTVQKLRATPGQWKTLDVIATNESHTLSSVAWKINHGGWAAFRPAQWFEAKAHDGVLYARFVGDDDRSERLAA
jgi:muconolactone delta-isomerase